MQEYVIYIMNNKLKGYIKSENIWSIFDNFMKLMKTIEYKSKQQKQVFINENMIKDIKRYEK